MALLIGNETYSGDIGRLINPHNDVALVEQALKGLGFEVVTVRDAGLGALTTAINAYARRVGAVGPGAVGFFYYSGHGASDGSTNYLIPIDVNTTETGELWDQSLQLTEITRKLKRDASNDVILISPRRMPQPQGVRQIAGATRTNRSTGRFATWTVLWAILWAGLQAVVTDSSERSSVLRPLPRSP